MNYIEKLSDLLRTSKKTLSEMEKKMDAITGKSGILKTITEENEFLISQTLKQLGLERDADAQTVHEALLLELKRIDDQIFTKLGKPDLSTDTGICGPLCSLVSDLSETRKKGFFLKRDKAIEMLSKNPPPNILSFFGYTDVKELIEKKGFSQVFAALRPLETNEWMHGFFANAYKDLTADDFEEREVEIIALDEQWTQAMRQFLKKKYHNVSHLKELGIIFIIPLETRAPGILTRLLALLLHYSNEVPFYSRLFKKFAREDDFADKLQSLLRGDVPEDALDDPGADAIHWRIVQRYLTKDDKHDFRLFEPHVNPEAEHWYLAERDLSNLIIEKQGGRFDGLAFPHWMGLDFVGDMFTVRGGVRGKELISFDLIDILMSLVREGKYLYHQQEALWNNIFADYIGRKEMNIMIEDNIIRGYITLKK